MEQTLTAKLTAHFKPSHYEVVDVSGGCGASFNVLIVSDAFAGVSLLNRQRAVHACLKDEMPAIHALSMKLHTPEQWAAKQSLQ